MVATITPSFWAEIKKGKLIFDKPQQFDYYLKAVGDRKIIVNLKPPRKPRSNNQNSYYWGVALPIIANEIGVSSEEAHDLMKIQFLKKRISEKLWTIKSTSTLNTMEFEEYIENVRRFGSLELNCIIPLPNEVEC